MSGEMLKIPRHINNKKNVITLILGTAVFALFFINIFQPFNSRNWVPNINDFTYFLFSSLIILTAMCVIAISRVVMFYYAKKHDISLVSYLVWILGEILAMSFFFTLFPIFALKVNVDFGELYKQAISYTSLVILFPYTILFLYFELQEKNKIIKMLGNQQAASQSEQANNQMSFCNERGDVRLVVAADSLFYIEASDNYVDIHYLNKGRIVNFLLRNSLKNIEKSFSDRKLLRCHRSYIVNANKVRIIRKTEEGLCIDFDYDGIPNIPISKIYSTRVLEQFSGLTPDADNLS
ncbi:MAG: LytTR family transcriptional regulator DNA-binding domain-containing protein [Paludibacteraceae bacterium]|nr:LytTR family transcriptional regulator DNA-binding domain-containing protein [Paludibacteraceae bacterium]